MSLLKDLEHELLVADEQLDRDAPGETPELPQHATESVGPLRHRWRRLSRRGRTISIIAGTVTLAGVATGSAEVAGLDPWSKLVREDRIAPGLRPTTSSDGSIGVRVEATSDRPGWELRAYVARDGRLCVVAAGRGGEGVYRCFTSDRAAAVLAGRAESGPPLTGVTQTGPPTMRPTRLVAWALTEWDAPQPRFAAPDGSNVQVSVIEPPLLVDVDRSPAGLSRRGRTLVKTLPRELKLRLTVAEFTRTRPAFSADMIAVPSTPARTRGAAAATKIEVTSAMTWRREHGGPWTVSDDQVLDRSNVPVRGSTPMQRRTFPVLARPRHSGDVMPASAVTADLREGRVAISQSRRLSTTGQGDLGPVWLVPGGVRTSFTVPTIDGQVCLGGPAVISGCVPTNVQGLLPEPQAVICTPGLARGYELVWAFVPAEAERGDVEFADGTSRAFPAGDLLVLVRPRSAPRLKLVRWRGPRDFTQTIRVRYPTDAGRAICGRGQAPRYWQLSTNGETHR